MSGTVPIRNPLLPSLPFPSESCIHLGTVFFLSSPVLSSYLPEQYFSVTFPGSFPNSITSTSIKPCWKNKELDKEIVKLLASSQNLGATHIYGRLVPSNIPTKYYAVIFLKCKCEYVPSLFTILTERPKVIRMKVRLLSFAQQGVCHQVCAFPFPQHPDCSQYAEHTDAGSALPPVPWRLHRQPALFSHTALVREYLSTVANTHVLQNSAQATRVDICIILTCTQLLFLLLHLSLSLPPPPLI